MPEYHFINERVFTVTDFFTPEECDAAIAIAESSGFDDAPITTKSGPVMRKDIRNNSRVMLDDHARAANLWSRITDYIPKTVASWEACGLNERFRFYRYDVGQQFDWHYDGAFRRSPNEQSMITFMIYLNDDFQGGATTIEGTEIIPKRGMALFFIHHMLHKGQPVESGRKYVLRTDVMYRRPKQT